MYKVFKTTKNRVATLPGNLELDSLGKNIWNLGIFLKNTGILNINH